MIPIALYKCMKLGKNYFWGEYGRPGDTQGLLLTGQE